MPGQEIEGVSCEVTRFVNSNSRLHANRGALGAEAYTSLWFSCKNF
jgi:hypothetical protein